MKWKILIYLLALSFIFYRIKIIYFPLVSFYPRISVDKIFKNHFLPKKYNENQIANFFQVNSKCQLCSFTIRNHDTVNSSPRDAIMTAMFLKSFNLIPSLRTLRSTGSKCGMIVFTDSNLYQQINKELFSFLQDCGCMIINSGELSTSRKKMLFMARNQVIYQFLIINHQFFNRIIIIDLYDTIFQGDPFNIDFLNDTIGLTLETTKIQGSHINGISILFGKENSTRNCFRKRIINCGTIIGTTQIVMKFLALFIQLSNSISTEQFNELVNTGFPDQAIVNALVCMNVLEKKGMKYYLYKVQEDFVSLHKIYRLNLNFTLGNFIFDSKSKYPLIVHLFDRSKMFCQSVLDACPQSFEMPFSYIRCLNLHR